MKFDDAWEAVLLKVPEDCRPKGDPLLIAQMFSMIWSIIAVALNDKQKSLDDLSYISQDRNIISIPLQKSETTKTAKDKTKPVKSKVDKADGKEKKEKPEPTTKKE